MYQIVVACEIYFLTECFTFVKFLLCSVKWINFFALNLFLYCNIIFQKFF